MSLDSESQREVETSALVAGGIAHELNNMLAAIGGTLQMVRDTLPSGKLVFELAAAERLVDRGAVLAHTLFSLERGDRGEREPVSVQKATEEILTIIENRLQKRRIDVHRSFTPVPDVMASRCGLLRVVLELIASAERAIDRQSGRIDVRIGAEGENEVWLSVTDNGVPRETPLSPTAQDRVSPWGGRLVVEVHPEVGTTRTLYLPVQHAPVEDGKVGAGISVLVVDDEKAIRKMLTVLLEARGFEVRTAESVDGALERLSKGAFDIVLLDLVMPGVQGTELLQTLHRDRPALPVIVISGESVDPSVEELKQAGAVGVMRKPLKLDRLARMCRAAVRKEPMPEA